MSPGSSSDPTTALQLLRTAVKSGYVGNMTVDPNVFSAVLKS